MTILGVCGLVGVLSWLSTRGFLRYANSRGLLDIPNERSSHQTPTPRGGGAAIVIATTAGALLLALNGVLPWENVAGILGGGLLIAAVGYIDDHRPLPAHWRLLGHFAAAMWLLAWMGRHAGFPLTDEFLHLGLVGDFLVLLYIVWVVNLTNFMDGIDGLASTEVITVAVGGSVLHALTSRSIDQWTLPLVLASACMGFLIWNWPPARIFMGDVGSGFVGFMLAALSLGAAQESLALFAGWLILMAVFVVDATVTLARRILRRERFYEAHRTHAYQHAAIRIGSHRNVTLWVGVLNVVWLLPLATAVATGNLGVVVGVLLAYAPLVIAAIWLGAGVSQSVGSRDPKTQRSL